MARSYILDPDKHLIVTGKCPICGTEHGMPADKCTSGKADMPEHFRANALGTRCPGSGMSIKMAHKVEATKTISPPAFKIPSDTDPFPFGKYQGIPYGKVPADYLDWLHGQPWIRKWTAVLAYIEANRRVIDTEL